MLYKYYVGVGSNIPSMLRGGSLSRVKSMHNCLEKLGTEAGSIIQTSFLYESEPAYITDQGKFLNCVVEVGSTLDPIEFFCSLKRIEVSLGREIGVRNGPRIADLDLLYIWDEVEKGYKNLSIAESEISQVIDLPSNFGLHVPHQRIHERNFVIEPLLDLELSPSQDKFPLSYSNDEVLWNSPMQRVLGLECDGSFQRINSKLQNRTVTVGIHNVSPDSFSDGGTNNLKRLVDSGVDMIDIGGESSRPGSLAVPIEVEKERLLSAFEELAAFKKQVVSVDTTKPEIVEWIKEMELPVDIINDISGGGFSRGRIFEQVGTDFVFVSMHSLFRPGDHESLHDAELREKNYGKNIALNIIEKQCKNLMNTAERAGIPAWNLISDPGFGFGKDVAQNTDLFMNFSGPTKNSRAFPLFYGFSRKRFVQSLSHTSLANIPELDFATAALVTSAILQNKCQFVRYHNPDLIGAIRGAEALNF